MATHGQLKFSSINFVSAESVPEVTKNTPLKALVDAIVGKLKNMEKGKAMHVPVEGAGKHTRQGLQQRLQGLGHKVLVRQSFDPQTKVTTFFIVRA